MGVDLKKLSAQLGLSPTTVSRALNGYADVSETTRRRVAETAEKLGYRPNMAARRLAIGRADAVGLVYPMEAADLSDPAFLAVMAGLGDRLDAAGIDLLLVSAREKRELQTYERLVRGSRVDGFIVARTRVSDARIDYLKTTRMPFVAYGRTGDSAGFPWFDFDNEAGTALAVHEMLALGHRRIAYVHAPLGLNFAFQRHAGFVRTLRAAGIEPAPEQVIAAGLNRRDGYAAAQQLLALSPRPTAILIDNNLCGIGVLRALLDAGIAVGREISVVVYDGVPPDTLLLGQKVASIEQPVAYESGRTLGDMLLALIEGRPLATAQVLRQPEFVGGSTLGPPAA